MDAGKTLGPERAFGDVSLVTVGKIDNLREVKLHQHWEQ